MILLSARTGLVFSNKQFGILHAVAPTGMCGLPRRVSWPGYKLCWSASSGTVCTGSHRVCCFCPRPKEDGGQGLVHLASRGAAFRLRFIQRLLAGPAHLIWRPIARAILRRAGGLGLLSLCSWWTWVLTNCATFQRFIMDCLLCEDCSSSRIWPTVLPCFGFWKSQWFMGLASTWSTQRDLLSSRWDTWCNYVDQVWRTRQLWPLVWKSGLSGS